jgi:hypothetical protein
MSSKLFKFYTFTVTLIGQVVLFLLLWITHPESFTTTVIEANIIWIRTILLVAGVSILLFILVKISTKYRTNPTVGRFNVLLGVISFVIATGMYLFSTSLDFQNNLLDRLVQDVSNIFLLIALNLFNVFGVYFLLATSDQARAGRIQRVLDTILMALYAIYYVSKIGLFLGLTSSLVTMLQELGEYLVILFGLVSLVFLLVIAIKALNITKRTVDEAYKSGLRSLGTSYIILFAGTFTLLLNSLDFDESKLLIVVAVMLLVVAFYFIYAGFVKPSGAKKD